jgi:exodeoxyribonuclease-3
LDSRVLKIVSWNVNSLRARLDYLCQWLELTGPDILLLQETKLQVDDFPAERFKELGYSSLHHGQGRWNGVAILSREPLQDARTCVDVPGLDGAVEARAVVATTFGVRVMSVYVPNGRAVDDPHYDYKLAWLGELRDELAVMMTEGTPLLIGGDFNIAPSDGDVWSPESLSGMTHVSQTERRALADILSLGFVDAYRRFEPDGEGFSWWDYRGGAFHKNQGMRIDLVLLSEQLCSSLHSVSVDREARKVDSSGRKPSDHAPVTIELNLPHEENVLRGSTSE